MECCGGLFNLEDQRVCSSSDSLSQKLHHSVELMKCVLQGLKPFHRFSGADEIPDRLRGLLKYRSPASAKELQLALPINNLQKYKETKNKLKKNLSNIETHSSSCLSASKSSLLQRMRGVTLALSWLMIFSLRESMVPSFINISNTSSGVISEDDAI
ncbi:hypothetical protein G4B88_017944 [Cannabis sativa]|uniref:Uncharacterized protein n=1 Tax=Cannabis sativa TaxID=3483 RepID=A0A7J6HIJ8_CANSA|nr:hypothetical protein G4B88_017944 [Cannabis sativa]